MKSFYSSSVLAIVLATTFNSFISFNSSAQLPSYVPANGLVAWYPFNGNANDESGNGNNGVVNGAVLTADRNGVANSAYYFSGSGCATRIDVDVNTSSIQTGLTISVWVLRAGSGCIGPRLFEFFPSSGDAGAVQWIWDNSGYTRFGGCTSNGTCINSSFNAVPDNQWTYLSFTNDGSYARFYQDGLLINTIASSGNPILASNAAIGRMNHPAYDAFNGKIDDLGIWNRALTEAEVQALYTSQSSPVCNLGNITTPASTICAGESISLVAQPSATAGGCFTPKVKQAGNQNFGITSTHRDAQGNYYMSGAYSGATTIDGIAVSSIGNRDIFLAKYNSCGQIQWVARGGSSGDQDYAGEGSHGIATDASGNVYIVGRYNQAFTFYGANSSSFSAPWTSTSNANHQDGFLVKLNSSGQVVWGASLRGTSNDGFVGVAVDGAGNPVVTGGFNGCCPSSFAVTIYGPNGSVGVSSFGSNYGSGLVVKFDTNGNILWKAAVYNRDTGLSSVAIDGSNNIYLTSSFRSWSNGTAAQFIDASGANNSLFNPGIGLGFLVKLNASGNWQWGTSFGNVGDGVGSLTSGADVAIDASGNPWVVGYFRGAQATVYSTNGANLTIPASTNDIGFLISYNAAGVAQSVVTRQQSTGATYYRSLAIANNKIVVAGHFTGANAGLSDILLANYTSAGSFIDAQTAGGAGDDYGLSIIPSNSAFAVCGSTAGGFTLDGVSVPSACTYLWNLGAAQGQATVSWSNGATTPTISVSPSTTTTYTATFSDGTNACSKEVTVTVNQPTSSAIEATITEGESYDFNGQSLTTAGTYEAVLVNAAGCDSLVVLNLVVESIVLDCSITANDTQLCPGEEALLSVPELAPCAGSGQPEWQLLIPGSAFDGNQVNFDQAGFDAASGKLYSVLRGSGINRVYAFDLNAGSVSSLNSAGGPGELYEFALDISNARIVANRVGRDAVYTLPFSGGTWQSLGGGSFDAESYGCASFWNPITNRFGYFGGYGYYATKNWVWESGASWLNTYANNNGCTPPKRVGTQLARNASGGKIYLFSGQGSCDGNQFASSCSLGSPWATDVGVYCWLRDIWELDLATYQFTNVMPINSQSITKEGAFAYDFEEDDFYVLGGFTPSPVYGANTSASNTMDVRRYRRGTDTGFEPLSVGGAIPPTPNSNTGIGMSVYDAVNNRIIYARKDGIWALSLSSCNNLINWSTGETTSSITVAPAQTTTYSVTVTQGAQTCTSEVTITVNQPSSSAIEATIIEGESYDFNGQTLTTAGTYEAVLVNAAGCDSTVTLTLSVEPSFDCSIAASDVQICAGESVTLTSAATGSVPSLNYSLDFPNTAQYSGNAQAVGSTNKDGFNLTGDFTIEFWIKAEGSFYWHLMGKNTFGNNSQGWLLKKPGANLGIGWTYVPNEFDFHSFNFGNWEHVAICFDDASNTFRYFKNGVLTTTQARDININASPYDLVIGHELGTGNWFDGKLDNLRISNISRYSGNFNPTQTFLNDANTVAMYDFNEGSGNVAQDISGNGRVLNLFNTNYSADVPAGSAINQSALTWSTGSQEQTITVTPEITTTYYVTYDDGTALCQDSITITVLPNATYYADADGDGFGNFEMPLTTCDVIVPEGYTLDNTDCNDGDPLNYPFASCDDGDVCTIEDVIQADCTCAGFFADSDGDGTCDAEEVCQGTPEPGTACDDNDPCTANDLIQADCTCFGTIVDQDNDGVCDLYDTCLGSEAGTACDDNDPCTVNDIILADCSCAGTFADADNDGTCDANDNCAGPEAGTACDDNDPCTVNDIILADCSCAGTFADADNDGTCDANDLCAGPEAGAACDDNDPCTVNDIILADCTCAGTFADIDNDGTCDANDLCAGPEAGSACDDNDPCTVSDIILTDCSCAGTFADADNDGTCDANDLCAGPEAGTACDDNDPCTVGDVILADCSCAGTFADADNDGTCDANDLCAGPEAGAACDDNDPCTVSDIILADCTCAGTFADADDDGTCDANDLCAGPEAGTACDDNDPCTVGDVILADCSCAGTFADADNDGNCDANDLCAGPEAGAACDDNDPCTVNDIIREDCSCVGVFIDSDEDGVCDANDLCAGPEAGSICDDNNPCTVDDLILADCSCAGTIADSDNDGVCDAFDLCFGPEPGSNCDDGNPCTINDVVNEACTCMGDPVAVNTSITSATACDSYVWNGQQYTASGTYTIQITNAAGCDSLATLVLEIRQSSFAPQSASASLTTITAGQSVTLSVVGGSLGTDAQWMWYSGSCGGTLIGQGASISVSPSETATYFVRAVGVCNTTACASVTVNVSALPCGPQTIAASSTSICAGNAVTLSVTGVLSTGAVWKWYKNGCGLGTSVGTGATIAVIPTTNTSYFVRAEGGSCGLTSCLSVAITVASVPAKPTVISGPTTALCSQQGVVYSTPQLAGVNSYLWTVPSGATIVSGQGTSSITVNFSSSIGPNSTCGYTGICVSALNGCGASLHHCMQVSLTPGAPAGIVSPTAVCRFQEATFSVLNPIAGMNYTWEVPNNWQILSGQGTSTITVMVGLNNGQVRVYASNACGISKKFSRYVGPINCERSASALEINLWPNPAGQSVKFAHSGTEPEMLEIYDLLGREIYSGAWVGDWNVETLEAGVYFIRATLNGESIVKRLEVAR